MITITVIIKDGEQGFISQEMILCNQKGVLRGLRLSLHGWYSTVGWGDSRTSSFSPPFSHGLVITGEQRRSIPLSWVRIVWFCYNLSYAEKCICSDFLIFLFIFAELETSMGLDFWFSLTLFRNSCFFF